MELEQKNYLFCLLLLPILAALFLWIQHWKKTKSEQFAQSHLFKKIVTTKSNSFGLLRTFLFFAALLLIIVSLVNPKYGKNYETIKSKGIDVIFAVDLSKSMLAEDIAPNRLEKAKQIASQIINKLQGDRVGIIAYSGSAFPVMPITTDYGVAKMFVKSLEPEMISEQGSSIDQAIEIATESFNKKSKSNKLLILLSDGEDHSDQAESSAQKANSEGIKIITVGIGTEKGAPIPIKENGINVGFKRDSQENVVITKRNATILKTIANSTNQDYVDGNNSRSATNYIVNIINKYQKTENSTTKIASMNPTFQWFIALAFLVLLIDFFIIDRRNK